MEQTFGVAVEYQGAPVKPYPRRVGRLTSACSWRA